MGILMSKDKYYSATITILGTGKIVWHNLPESKYKELLKAKGEKLVFLGENTDGEIWHIKPEHISSIKVKEQQPKSSRK